MGKQAGNGCGSVLYWITIGWIIAVFKAGKWIFQTSLILIHKLSVLLEKELSDRGHYWGLKKVKAGVTAGVLVLLVSACLLTSQLGRSAASPTESSSMTGMRSMTQTMPAATAQSAGAAAMIPSLQSSATHPAESVRTATVTSMTTVTVTVTSTSIPQASPTVTLPATSSAFCVPADHERVSAKVVRIVDGDTIEVEIDGTVYKLRYIGMDTPESGDPGGSAATEYNRGLVEGKTVTLVKDVSEVDRYDRLLRFVFVDGVFVNYELVRAGFATSGSWPPDTSCDQVFAAAEKSARSNLAGLWLATTVPLKQMTSTIAASAGTAVSGGSCPQGCTTPPAGCVIKGNISSKGEKIYHVPGGQSYAATVITPSKGERWFCTEKEAQENGWRKAKR
jgi:micrococcal nuclease